MYRPLVLAVLTALLIGCTSCMNPWQKDDLPTTSDPSIVQLVQMQDGEVSGRCTAWKVGENRVMTAGHCCDVDLLNPYTYTVKGSHAPEGQLLTILHNDDEHDVCLMKGMLTGAPLRLAAFDPKLGEQVWTAGYPKGQFLISSGYWSGRDHEDRGKASVAVWGGASGSPIMNSRGEAVGILIAYYPPMSNMAVIAPLEWMKHAVELDRLSK